MSLLMYTPLTESVMPIAMDFDLDDMEDFAEFRTLSEAPPAESLEPSLQAALQLPVTLANMSADDIWKDLSSDDRPPPSPVPCLDYMDDADVIVKQEFEEDLFSWQSALLDTKPLRNDCMWLSESPEVPVAAKSVVCAPTAAPSATVVKEVAPVASVKCEPNVVAIKCESVDPEDTVVAVSCGPVVTTVAGASANTMRTGVRAQTSLLNKSEVSLLKSNNRSLLISSRTSAACSSSHTIPTSPVKNNVLPERSERGKVPTSVMWGPRLNSAVASSCFQQSSLESDGDSPRPYTPPSQSESEEDDEHPRFKHTFDLLGSSLFDVDTTSEIVEFSDTGLDFDEDIVASLAEAAEQLCRPSVNYHASESGRAKSNSRKSESAARREEIESSRLAFMSDHSYHLSKGAVKTEHLGVQTPSDSEEEIDVVSVGEKHCARTSAASTATALPTNPSARDRQQLQLTVASAITAKRGGRAACGGQGRGRIPVRITLGDCTVGVRSLNQAMVVDPAYDEAVEQQEEDELEEEEEEVEEEEEEEEPEPEPEPVPEPELPGPSRGRPGRKRGGGAGRGGSVKRQRVHYQHRLQHHTPRGRGRRPRGSDDSEPDPTERRSLHNDMERQRRIDLRNLVDDLRKLVPDLKDNKRAAKVMILREAAKHCRSLTEEGRVLLGEYEDLQLSQEKLMVRLSTLRRNFAARRL